jgi:hypothetical protein
MTRKKKMGTRAARSAAAQMGTISLRSGSANWGYTTSPSEKVMAKEREGAGGAK